MKPFVLQRDVDETGISGTGVVAEGIVFEDGHVAMRWRTETSSTAYYVSIDDVLTIHGHDGKTRVAYVDEMSTWTVNGEPRTWKQMYEREHEDAMRLGAWATLVSDLDRCEHGRHEGDVCGQCGGPSKGNPNSALAEGANLGYDLSGNAYIVPPRRERHVLDAWRPEFARKVGQARDVGAIPNRTGVVEERKIPTEPAPSHPLVEP